MVLENAVQVTELRKEFGSLKAVQGISFDVQMGEIFSLLGPNGAGKSTTISMLSCLLAPSGGDALIMGHSISREPQAVKSQIGLVPQEIALYQDLSARENLFFWGKMYGLSGQELSSRVSDVLELLGLTERQKEPVSRYSGGMKRRLNIGISLLHKPHVVFMDEPTVGIDPQSRRNILEHVKELKRGGMTVLYTTHYMEEAQEISDHIAIMDHGRVIAAGTHEELLKIVGELDRIDLTINAGSEAVLSRWQDVLGVRHIATDDGQITLLVDDSNQTLPLLFETASQAGVRISSVELHEPNLEVVFLHLTGRALRDA